MPELDEWLQLTVALPHDALEQWENALQEVGALSITYRDAHDNPVFEPGPGEVTLWESLKLTALFSQGSKSADVLRHLSAAIGSISVDGIQIETFPDRHWERAWLDNFSPTSFGNRLWVVPTGMEPPQPEAVNLRLDPGLAFGTGTHPTTALCLKWLDANDLNSARVIDYGCGSGILGIAALLLGAEQVWATDIDGQALQATQSNAQVNGVAERLHFFVPEQSLPAPVDIVIANILAGPLVNLAPRLASLCLPDSRIVLSGLLAEQFSEVEQAYTPWFHSIEKLDEQEWLCVHGVRNESVVVLSENLTQE
ncbi:MAG: 50S ribosomal protein L11 methyltransferase [Pseudomonadota bacterium]